MSQQANRHAATGPPDPPPRPAGSSASGLPWKPRRNLPARLHLQPLLRKESRQLWRSFQLPAFLLIVLFFALLDPLTARYQNELWRRFAQGIEITLPPPTAAQALSDFIGDAASIGLFVLILITMGTIAQERESGVTEWLLTRPVSRRAYVLAKALVLGLGITATVALTMGVASLYTWSLFGSLPTLRQLLWAGLGLLLHLLLGAAITLTASASMRSAWAAAGIGFLFWAINGTSYALLHASTAARFLPYAVAGRAAEVLAVAPTPISELWRLNGPAMLLAAALIIAAVSFAVHTVNRQET